ncbi:hypothetical protein [Insolitispirillum peregrinum]|uniref:hypothetical protein n=1 Tax=Insolitispirillum peregrinum TaxID=80876 RepID=UPI00361989D5
MKTIIFADYAAALSQRKATLGIEAPVNDGARRTPEKRALLQELEDRQRAIGQQPVFQARY